MFKFRKEKKNEYAYDVNQQALQSQIDEINEVVEEHRKRIEGLMELMEQMQETCRQGMEQ